LVDDRDLMALRADTLFTYEARGRMALTNEPCEIARRPAPRLFLGRTAFGHVVRLGVDVPDPLARQLAAVAAAEPADGDLHIPSPLLGALRLALAKLAPVMETEAGPAYRFPASIAGGGEVVSLTAANRALTRGTFPWLYDECADWQPCFMKAIGGAAVSVCFSARIGSVVAEAGVETLPAYRGRGYATAVVAAWGDAVRASGRIPLYSTSWNNDASQGVARRLGLVMFGTDATLT
jgi:GNAT superfamily N-acetyltransferase